MNIYDPFTRMNQYLFMISWFKTLTHDIFPQVVSHLLKSNELRKANGVPLVSRMPGMPGMPGP